MKHIKVPNILFYFTPLIFLTACGVGNSLTASVTDEASVNLTIYTYKDTDKIRQACEACTTSHARFTYDVIETTADACQQELKRAADIGNLSTIPDIVLLPDNNLAEFHSDYPELFENSDISYDTENTWLITTNCSDTELAVDILEYASFSPSQ